MDIDKGIDNRDRDRGRDRDRDDRNRDLGHCFYYSEEIMVWGEE